MQERDVGSLPHLTTQKGDRMSMDIQSEVQRRRFCQPLQSATRSEMIRTNTWSWLRRELYPGDQDDDGANRNCACCGERVTPLSNARQECLSSRQTRRGVHGTTTRLQFNQPFESRMPTQDATLRP